MMRRIIGKNHVVRRAVTPIFVGCMALGVPAVAVLGSPASAGAATTHVAASADPLGDLVASIEANINYYECELVLSVQGILSSISQPGSSGFCIQPPPVS